MITLLRTLNRRIAFAIALSALMHAAILWLPQIRLPRNEVQLPPLTARLEPLPKHLLQSVKSEPAKSVASPGSTASAQSTAKAVNEVEESAAHHLFPNHVYLTFAVYNGVGSFKVGNAYHRLDINEDRYTLKAVKRITGLAGLLNDEQTTQTSRGKIINQGLQPESFMEEKIINGRRQYLKTTFDWAGQRLRYSRGGETPLIDDAQDALSFAYQLSQLSMRTEIIPLAIFDGKLLENGRLEMYGEEDISTPMGKMRTLHLRKMHVQGETYFEIWLGLEHRLLPVKFRRIDSSDKVTEEAVISDIRVADE